MFISRDLEKKLDASPHIKVKDMFQPPKNDRKPGREVHVRPKK